MVETLVATLGGLVKWGITRRSIMIRSRQWRMGLDLFLEEIEAREDVGGV